MPQEAPWRAFDFPGVIGAKISSRFGRHLILISWLELLPPLDKS
ncbi:hypothetical protein AWT69_000136 [Pseudomonas putida]|nr:hypothetical protein AWT69_000136 [Pseudomonas putida]